MGEQRHRWAVVVALVAFAAASLPFVHWIPDDAYISFEYARNLAQGHGLVFNAGERVEGFSNLLWTLLLAGIGRLGADIATWAPLLALAFGFGAVALFVRILAGWLAANHPATPLLLGCSAIVAGFFFPLAFYASSGLETPFYLCCVLAGTALYLRGRLENHPASHALAILAWLAAALTRPEAILFLLVNSALTARHGDRRARWLTAAALVVYAVVWLVKFRYYGLWLPNTYYAKPGAAVGYAAPIFRGLAYLLRFFAKSGLWLILPFAVMRPPRGRSRARAIHSYLWMIVFIQCGFIVFVGADVLRFDRFTIPFVLPLVALAAVSGQSRLRRDRGPARLAVVALTLVIVALNVGQSYLANRKYCIHDWMHATALRRTGEMIHDMQIGQGVIVANEIGAIRYYGGMPVVDMLGLTDRTVSRIRFESFQKYGIGSSDWSARAVSNYLLARRPSAVLLPTTRPLDLKHRETHAGSMHPLWFAIFTHPDFEASYDATRVIRIHENKYIYLFLRRGTAARETPPPPAARCFEVTPL